MDESRLVPNVALLAGPVPAAAAAAASSLTSLCRADKSLPANVVLAPPEATALRRLATPAPGRVGTGGAPAFFGDAFPPPPPPGRRRLAINAWAEGFLRRNGEGR